MAIKLIDCNIDNAGLVTFEDNKGWVRTIYVDNPKFVFEDNSGKRLDIDGYLWDQGDYSQVNVYGVPTFASWLEKDFNKHLTLGNVDSFSKLEALVDDYDYYRENNK